MMKKMFILISYCIFLCVNGKQIFEIFWLHDTGNFSSPSFRSIVDHKPYVDIVTVSCAYLSKDYLVDLRWIKKKIDRNDIMYVKNRGVKVLLSIVGHENVGWSCIPEKHNMRFSRWVKKEIIEDYGFDGIDIDDEYSACNGKPIFLNKTVHCLRNVLGNNIIIKKDLLNDEIVIPMIKNVLDYGSTMVYGNDWLISEYNKYIDLGMTNEQLLIGVQAGPHGFEFTNLSVVKHIVKKGYNIMLFSYSQDTQEFTRKPQHSIKFPNKDDHMWMNTIQKYIHLSNFNS